MNTFDPKDYFKPLASSNTAFDDEFRGLRGLNECLIEDEDFLYDEAFGTTPYVIKTRWPFALSYQWGNAGSHFTQHHNFWVYTILWINGPRETFPLPAWLILPASPEDLEANHHPRVTEDGLGISLPTLEVVLWLEVIRLLGTEIYTQQDSIKQLSDAVKLYKIFVDLGRIDAVTGTLQLKVAPEQKPSKAIYHMNADYNPAADVMRILEHNE